MTELDHSPCREEVLRAEIERLRAALLDIGERAHSPIDDDHIWMDKRTTLGLYIDSLALEPKP